MYSILYLYIIRVEKVAIVETKNRDLGLFVRYMSKCFYLLPCNDYAGGRGKNQTLASYEVPARQEILIF